MKIGKLILGTAFAVLAPLSGWSAIAAAEGSAAPSTRTESERPVLAFTYPQDQVISVELRGTHRLPQATGEARIEREPGVSNVEVELEDMKPAHAFGGEINTYVLWAITPDGRAENLAEIGAEEDQGRLQTETSAETFGLIVTAEPHLLVGAPSELVVLETGRPTGTVSDLRLSSIEYGRAEADYDLERESLESVTRFRRDVLPHLEEARVAIALAERADAERFAADELREAREALRRAESGADDRVPSDELMALAHQAVREALAAERVALESMERAPTAEQRMARSRDVPRSDAERTRDRQQAHRELQQALEDVVQVRDAARGLILNIPNVVFDVGEATLKQEGREKLARIAGVLQLARGYELSVEGHTDDTGTPSQNLELSRARAESVRDYLIEQGIPAELIDIEAFGETRPIASNETGEGRQENRRVEIVVEELENFTILVLTDSPTTRR